MHPRRTVFMTAATRQMAADTVMRYRQMTAALEAVSIHEWPTVRLFPPNNPVPFSPCAVWEDVFLSDERTVLPRYRDWFQTEFGDAPDVFQRWAVSAIGRRIWQKYPLDQSHRDFDLRQLLTTRRYWDFLRLEFRKRREAEVIERPTWGRLRLRLFDRSTGRWDWQEAAFETETSPSVPITDGGVVMLPVPPLNARVTVQVTQSLNLSSDEPLDIEPVLDRLPFRDMVIPAEYWDADRTI